MHEQPGMERVPCIASSHLKRERHNVGAANLEESANVLERQCTRAANYQESTILLRATMDQESTK